MKYNKLSQYQLADQLESLLKRCFMFKATQLETMAEVNKFFDYHFKTETGKQRYSKTIHNALSVLWYQTIKRLQDENTIFCYVIDGKLYTTFNAEKPNNYYFKGETKIPNYRQVESRLIELRKQDVDVVSGSYYPCGKPYFVLTKI
jgi:hypothetical protein